jgi:uncharacterized protein (TIGR03435 family)
METSRMRVVAVACLLLAGSVVPRAQAPAFEVTSVKESPPPTPAPDGRLSISLNVGPRPGGRWEARNATLLMILRAAYDGFSLPGQIAGTPEWADQIRFDIDAIAGGDPPPAQMNEMVKRMLAERFALKVRIEPREVEAYALVLARDDGRLGPGIRPSSVDCEALAAARTRGEAPPAGRPLPGERPQCGSMGQVRATPAGRVQTLTAGGVPMASVVSAAQGAIGRPVLDQTGLAGRYDIDLEWARAELRAAPDAGGDVLPAPSISTALQEQLGLRLEPGRHRMDVLIVEHVERPTAN